MSKSTAPEVLVIEDDAIMREAMAEWLAAAGYGVRQAEDGTAGLDAVRSAEPALVITDMNMPRTNGWTVIAELKRLHPAVSVIAISGHFGSEPGLDAGAAIALGASRVLLKPFKRRELLRALADLLGS
jgi:CheY-like chemotaxis protein